MTNTFPQPKENAYRLSDELLENGVSPNVITPLPGEADREELVLAKLGTRGWGRLHHFRHYYTAGWGEHVGRPLSPRALETFYRFLENAQFQKTAIPSLFLTDAGTLELCWEDHLGKAVQIEFKATGIEFYVESSENEGSASSSQAAEIAEQLTSS